MSANQLNASNEKKRRLARERYSSMTTEQREILLYRNREYKKGIKQTITLSDQSDIALASGGPAYRSPSTPAIHGEESKNNPIGILTCDCNIVLYV